MINFIPRMVEYSRCYMHLHYNCFFFASTEKMEKEAEISLNVTRLFFISFLYAFSILLLEYSFELIACVWNVCVANFFFVIVPLLLFATVKPSSSDIVSKWKAIYANTCITYGVPCMYRILALLLNFLNLKIDLFFHIWRQPAPLVDGNWSWLIRNHERDAFQDERFRKSSVRCMEMKLGNPLECGQTAEAIKQIKKIIEFQQRLAWQ